MTEDYRLLSGAEVVDLLGELLERLAGRGVEVETYIVGGAAVAVHLGRDEVTPDIDGLFQPMDEVLVEARAMAAEHRLDPEWINSRAFSFTEFSPSDDTEALHTTINGRPVVVASKRRLLAMKLAASRPKDRTDLNRLIVDLDVRTAEELVAIARSVRRAQHDASGRPSRGPADRRGGAPSGRRVETTHTRGGVSELNRVRLDR